MGFADSGYFHDWWERSSYVNPNFMQRQSAKEFLPRAKKAVTIFASFFVSRIIDYGKNKSEEVSFKLDITCIRGQCAGGAERLKRINEADAGYMGQLSIYIKC